MADTSPPATRPKAATATATTVRVWDLPTRLFHWVLVVLIAGSWLTQHYDRMQWHEIFGYATAVALIFRLAWGAIGSDSARFGRFVRGPGAALRHLARLPRREPDTEVTHNAAGGLMVLAMLVLLIVQVATGSCANDEVSTEGPFAERVGSAASDWLSHIHALNFRLIEAAIVAHLLAMLVYRLAKGQNLVWPMITGRKKLPAGIAPPRIVGWARAAATLVFAAALVSGAIFWFGS